MWSITKDYLPHLIFLKTLISSSCSSARSKCVSRSGIAQQTPIVYRQCYNLSINSSSTNDRNRIPWDEPGEGLKNGWLPRDMNWNFHDDEVQIDLDNKRYYYEAYCPNVPILHDEDDCTYCEPVESESESESESEPDHVPGTFVPSPQECAKYVDIIITGETDPEHAKAWGNFRFWGRIRLYDGLIVMVRESVSLFEFLYDHATPNRFP
jgi:hypothetical protein